MSKASLHPAVAALLDSRRFGSLDESRHRFTVSREEALLRLREQARERDDERRTWTLHLVRAANALSEQSEARVDVELREGEDLRVVTIDVITPGVTLDGDPAAGSAVDLTDILAGALEPDLGEPLAGAELDLRLARFRMLIGRALNAALARGPYSIELQTPGGGRRFERREQLLEGRDPYVERKVPGCEGHSRFVVRVVEAREGLGSRLGRWLRRRGELTEELAALWRANRLADHELDNREGSAERISLGAALRHAPVELGEHALFGPMLRVEDAPAVLRGSLFLVRDGILVVDLGPALREHQLDPVGLAGWVDCPKLRLTADERNVVRDANFELLVAWLHDYDARVDGDGNIAWPEHPSPGPSAASGRTIRLVQLEDDARRGRELVYVWRHQAALVPAYAKAKVAALWPSEELLLREHLPDLRLVPLRALGNQGDVDPADLTALAQGSYEPLALIKDSPVAAPGEAGALAGGLRVSVDAYIHRARSATSGFVVILAYERRVAQFHERAKVVPGVTLICRVEAEGPALDVAALRRDHATLATIVEQCRRLAIDHHEALLAHVMRRANPWENPLLRGALDELGPPTIELRYAETEDGVRLAWRDSVLLDLVVGRTREGEAKTLRDGLRQLRERGLILVGHPLKRFAQIRSDDPLLRPWLVDDEARAVLARVLGAATLIDMPVVAEVHPLVREDPVEDQRHLVRGRETIERELQRSATDPLARLRLLGHLLVARGLQQDDPGSADTLGLETVPLLNRYDPRAATPTRLVSLASVLSERPRPGMVPAGAVHRNLPRPMLEVVPGLAALLAEVEELEPGVTSGAAAAAVIVEHDRGPSERSTTAPIRRRVRGIPPLLAKAVVHPLIIGRLQVAGDGSSDGIGLWAKGLRKGELTLPEPLGRVSGRLLLTPLGLRVPDRQIEEQVVTEARSLLADTLRQRALLPPDGPQRKRLDALVEYVRAKIREHDRFDLADDFGLTEPEDRGRRVALLKQMSLGAAPLRPLGRHREALLVDVVRQSLAMAVNFDTAMLSWKPAKLGKRRRDGSFELEFGLRNRWIQRALDEDRQLSDDEHLRAALLAAVFVVGAFFEQGRARDDVELTAEHLVVALWRLLRLASA